MNNLPENLSRLRGLHKLILADAPIFIGISPQCFSELCAGSRKPGLQTMLKISDFFEVPIEDLLNSGVESFIFNPERYFTVEAKKYA